MTKPKIPKVPHQSLRCGTCGGTGKVDCIPGDQMRSMREDAGISIREMARRIGISPMYLSDLELGRRRFSDQLAEEFVKEIGYGA